MLHSLQITFTVLNFYLLCASSSELEYIRNRLLVLSSSDKTCNITGGLMTCEEIPETVPDNIKAVVITNHTGTVYGAFRGQGWRCVERLQIRGPVTYEIMDHYLKGLDNVRELTLIFPRFNQFSSNAFAMTPNVTKLSLLEMDIIFTNTLLDALTQHGVLNNLTEFIFNPGNVRNKPAILFTEEQSVRLLEKQLTLVNVSNSIIIGNSGLAIEFLIKLDILNISGCYLIPIKGFSLLDLNRLDAVPLLKVIDISGTRSPYRLNAQLKISLFERVIFSIEHVYASDASTASVVTLSHNLTQEDVLTKTCIARRNKIQRVEANITLNINNSFELLDLSENFIDYISPESIINAVHLRTLKLSVNRLSAMEKSSDFPKLLRTFSNLVHLYMDQNNISLIPWAMFVYNKKLEVLNLADNRLTTVDFNLAPLTSLQTLDIRRNDIHFIEGSNLARLGNFVHTIMHNSNRTRIIQLLFQGNPLECTCESSDFIDWVYNYTTYMNTKTRLAPYKCHYDSSTIEITKDAVDKSKFLCVRTLIISCSVIGSATVCTVVTILFWACLRARRRRRNRRMYDDFQQAFDLGILKQDRVCFAAYASHDEDTVREVLLNPLGNKLQGMLETHRNTIATGYDFRPGFPIYEEAFRVVQNCCVFLAVVSDAFCESEYCLGEVQEACTQQKPIIVVLLGRVTVNKMSKYLLEPFRRNARASILKTDDGNCELIPGVHQISESILTLSLKAYGREH